MDDTDLTLFANGLNQTKPGLRLRMSIAEAQIALRQISRLYSRGISSPRALRNLQSWQAAYIRASDSASQAIDELWDTHQWPADSARDRTYRWHPTATRRPR